MVHAIDLEACREKERQRIAELLMERHDELQQSLALGSRPMASMVTGTLRDIVEEISPGYVAKREAANLQG